MMPTNESNKIVSPNTHKFYVTYTKIYSTPKSHSYVHIKLIEQKNLWICYWVGIILQHSAKAEQTNRAD